MNGAGLPKMIILCFFIFLNVSPFGVVYSKISMNYQYYPDLSIQYGNFTTLGPLIPQKTGLIPIDQLIFLQNPSVPPVRPPPGGMKIPPVDGAPVAQREYILIILGQYQNIRNYSLA
jgi:hypothetical protein